MVSGAADASLSDGDAGPRRQYDIDQGDLLKFSEDLSRFVAKVGAPRKPLFRCREILNN
jgi:hypothetical protein